MSIFEKKRFANGRIRIYLFGIKIFSYKIKKHKKTILDIHEIQKEYQIRVEKLRRRVKKENRLNVAFLVSLSSMFPARPLMEKMLKDSFFKVSIFVTPDFRFGLEKATQIQQQTILELATYRENLVIVPISAAKEKIRLTDYADIVIPALPYDVSHSEYDLREMIQAGILPAMVNYGFFRSYYDRECIISRPEYSCYWKVFVETVYNLQECQRYSQAKGANAVLTGYCKMDNFINRTAENERKTVMIAPHHSLPGGFNDTLALSNFEKYAGLFLKLPELYPNLDFIFRPHPALFMFLSRGDQWGKEKVEQYILKLKSKPNVVYSEKGDYFEEFLKSDALIDDCGSYLVEYFYTKKPQCYLLKTPSDIQSKFVELGQKCLSNCYIAYEEKEILAFIENVVINGNDPKRESRIQFAEKDVMYNYPNVAMAIIDELKQTFI